MLNAAGEGEALVPGRVAVLGPSVRRILAPNPGPLTGPGTNTYLFGERRVVLVDPGPRSAAHTAAILAALGDATLVAILVTHSHADHSAGTPALLAARPAPVLGRPPRHGAFHDPSFQPSATVAEGESVASDAGTLEAVLTPGHASNHVCWRFASQRLLCTGDHVLGTTSPVILPPDGDMDEYLEALHRLQALDLDRLLPGHGPPLTAPHAVIGGLIRHRLAREARVVAALAGGAAPIAGLVPRAYADVDASLWPWAARTLEAHLLRLEKLGRARRSGPEWRLA